MSVSCMSSLCLNVTNVFALNCNCVVTLSMRLIKFDSVNSNCSANKHTQSNCNDEIKWTSYSMRRAVNSAEAIPESSCSYIV